MDIFKSKKVILTLVAMVLITIATIFINDAERLSWFVGVIATITGCYNIGQGIADGGSGGRTSWAAEATSKVEADPGTSCCRNSGSSVTSEDPQ